MKTVTTKQFKALILAQIALVVIAILSTQVSSTLLPDDLQKYVYPDYSEPVVGFAFDIVLGIFLVVIGIWGIQNLFALYNFKKYARKHAVIILAFYYVTGLFFPLQPSVVLGYENYLFDLSAFLSGIIIALLYFSNISTYFESDKVSNQEPLSGA